MFLFHLYDVDKDNAAKGICCSRIKYYKFPRVKCSGAQFKQEEYRRKLFPKTSEQLNQDPNLANHCLEIFIYEQAYWKICHREEDEILKLKQVLDFAVIRTVPGVDQNQLMSKFYKTL